VQTYGEKLDEREARKIFQQLIDALDYCHNKGVYHRDLKVSSDQPALFLCNGNVNEYWHAIL